MIEANSQSTASQDALIILSDEDSCGDTRLSQGVDTSSGPLSFSGLISASKQKDQEKKVQELPYPAFPTVSHVLQKGKSRRVDFKWV